jgi:hypothetical protein
MKHTAMSTPESELDARVDGLYRLIKGRIDWSNLVPTCLEVARELEGATQLSGKEKLDVLQKTLKFALKESEQSAEEKEVLLHRIDTVVPIIMQAAVMSSKLPIQAAVVTCWKKCVS